MFFIEDETGRNGARIKVVGVGGGGGNAINTMIDSNLEGVEFIAANTDQQALNNNKALFKIQIGKRVTQGLGAGGNPDVGREAAKEDEETFKNILKGADMVFITAGLGGGTGTGAAPVIAKAAKEVGALTVAVVTKPFLFEGKRRQQQAEKGFKELKSYVDTLISIPNQRLLNVLGHDTTLVEGFKKVDEVLLHAVQGLADLINKPGFINLDFSDVKTVMKNKGVALMGLGVGRGEGRAKEAVMQALTSPLLENIAIDGATGVIVNITAGPDLPMAELPETTSYVTDLAAENAEVIVGIVIDEKMGDEIRVTVVATGFSQINEQINHNHFFSGKEGDEKPKDRYEEYIPGFNVKKYLEKVEKKRHVQPIGVAYHGSSSSTPQEDEWDIPAFIRNRKYRDQ